MLKNEKYKGDCLLQKYYTPENMRGRTVRNNGEVQVYYIEENHPAIVSTDVCQDSCRKSCSESFSGFSHTSFGEVQFRIDLDQRSGFLCFANCFS